MLGFAVPNVRDAAPDWLPPALVIMFRTFTAVGHLAVVVGDSIRHRWVPAIPAEGYPRLPAILEYRRQGVAAFGLNQNDYREGRRLIQVPPFLFVRLPLRQCNES